MMQFLDAAILSERADKGKETKRKEYERVRLNTSYYKDVDYSRLINLEGNKKIAFTSSNTPSTAMPSRRNGKVIIHTMGYKIKATIANGAQTINKISQSKKVII